MSEHIDPVRQSSSSGASRRQMLLHLQGCASCRKQASDHDPSLLFGLLALAPLPATLLDELSASVAKHAGSDRPSYGALAEAGAWPRRAAAAAAIILTILSGYATLKERPTTPVPASLFTRRADVEVDSGRGVSQVIDLTVGDTQIVMVYNGELKL